MKEIFEELATTPIGRLLKKALETANNVTAIAEPLFAMQEQLLPRIRSRKTEFRLTDEAQAVFDAAGSKPHIISLARSHNWYEPALPHGFTTPNRHSLNDLMQEEKKQLAIRQGIDAQDGQFGIAGVSTMQLSRAVISTTKPGTAVLGDTVAWDGYTIPPALESRAFHTKPTGQSWGDYIAENFKNPKEEIGAIFITSPDSLTGKLTDEKVLRELLDIADKYDIKLVLNQVHATPLADGSLPKQQTDILAASTSKNLVLMASSTKQIMPYAVTGLEKAYVIGFYSPDPATVAKIGEAVDKLPASGPEHQYRIDPDTICLAVELLRATDHDFYTKNQKLSFDKRQVVDYWLSGHKGVDWYNGQMPDTTYHAVLTFDHELLAKNGVKTPHQLYDYILFSTGLDVAPIFDSGPGWAKNVAGDVSMRMNYSLPDNELKLALGLLDVAIDKMSRGVTLQQVYDECHKPDGTRLRADESAPAATTAAVTQPAAAKNVLKVG